MKYSVPIIGLASLLIWNIAAADSVYDAAHGNAQVAQMLLDRPAMSHYLAKDGSPQKVTPQDPIWQTAARAYGTIINGSTINWDKSDLQGGLSIAAQHLIPRNGNPGLIRIGASFQNGGVIRAQSFDELWANCIFELNNVTNAEKFMEVYNRAIKGEVTKKAWIDANTRLEYSALADLKTFYTKVWLPWSLKNRSSHDSACWLRGTPDTYEEWITKYPANSGYFKIWGSYYDKEIVPYVKQTKGIDPTLPKEPAWTDQPNRPPSSG